MRNIGPFGLENRIFAGICGLGALLLALILFGWGFFGSLIFGIIVGIIVLIWLLMRTDDATTGTGASGETSHGSTAAGTVTPTSAAAAAPAPQADVVKTETPVAAPEPVDAPVAEETVAPAPVEAEVEAPADTTETAEVAAPKVKESAKLPGEDDLASRKGEWKYEAPEAAPAAEDVAETVPAADAGNQDYDGDGVIEGENEGSKPATLTAAREGGADDLKQIKGVGPKMEGMLHGMGFFHFDQVAAWTAAEVAWVDANLKGFRGRVSRDNWVDQAKTLAAGGETEFSKKVEKGGVY